MLRKSPPKLTAIFHTMPKAQTIPGTVCSTKFHTLLIAQGPQLTHQSDLKAAK